MSNASLKTTTEWNTINWRKLERKVFKLQKRIYRASQRDDIKAVRRLQKTLTRSYNAKLLATRRVTQDNQGKKTAGVDGIKLIPPHQRFLLANSLKITGKSKPTRRVWIPKPGKDQKRPLGIPTMKDRATQALVKMALEPEWEARFEPNSYGFRPGRSCHDAIQQLFMELKNTHKYALDADITKCFDQINHEKLLQKINTYPSLKKQIKAWLKSGVLENGTFEETASGTPQGGVISPLLANIALHGMEEYIRGITGHKVYQKQPHLIRYADDFVILHKEIEVVMKCKEAIQEWLEPIGLKLNQTKTRICNTLSTHDGEAPGFDFLGFNIRHYPTDRRNAIKLNTGRILEYTLSIRPSKEKVKQHSRKLLEIVRKHGNVPQETLIIKLNPVIKGWCNYYSTVVSKKTFSKCDNSMWHKLRRWGKKRHPNKTMKWVLNKYWHKSGSRKYVFSYHERNLTNHASTPIKRFVKVQGSRSPYDGDWVYWGKRMSNNPLLRKTDAILLKKQEGKCTFCHNHFTPNDKIERDHIVPKSKGGKNEIKNYQLLHKHCHDSKTANDNIPRCINDNDYPVEEPCEVKVSSTVLKTSRFGDKMA